MKEGKNKRKQTKEYKKEGVKMKETKLLSIIMHFLF